MTALDELIRTGQRQAAARDESIRANKDHADVLDQQRQADERRHTEAMTALDELIRTGQRQAAALDESIRASQRQTAALDELLRRTGGPQPAN